MANDNSREYYRRVCRAIDFINQHLADSPSVVEIARAAPFSPFHFQRLFRALVGESVAEFTRRIRLETAARRLRFRPREDVTTLAIQLGFSSSQNFAKAFKKHFGVSATQYRSQHRDEAFGDSAEAEFELQDVALPPKVEVTTQPELRVAYRRVIGSYDDPQVNQAFGELIHWAQPRGIDVFERYLGIPWDDANITEEERCRFDACLEVDETATLDRGVNWQTIPAGLYATYRCEITHNDFDRPWTDLMRNWLPISGYQPDDRPRFERYHTDGTDDPEGRWEVSVWLPVVPL